jgi:hypothetical protein
VGHVFLLIGVLLHPIYQENVALGYDFVKSAKLLLLVTGVVLAIICMIEPIQTRRDFVINA